MILKKVFCIIFLSAIPLFLCGMQDVQDSMLSMLDDCVDALGRLKYNGESDGDAIVAKIKEKNSVLSISLRRGALVPCRRFGLDELGDLFTAISEANHDLFVIALNKFVCKARRIAKQLSPERLVLYMAKVNALFKKAKAKIGKKIQFYQRSCCVNFTFGAFIIVVIVAIYVGVTMGDSSSIPVIIFAILNYVVRDLKVFAQYVRKKFAPRSQSYQQMQTVLHTQVLFFNRVCARIQKQQQAVHIDGELDDAEMVVQDPLEQVQSETGFAGQEEFTDV